jgi:hypothetical protein
MVVQGSRSVSSTAPIELEPEKRKRIFGTADGQIHKGISIGKGPIAVTRYRDKPERNIYHMLKQEASSLDIFLFNTSSTSARDNHILAREVLFQDR